MSGVMESHNPFPGPQPYRAADRHHFFGRDALVKKLANQVLARPLTTLYGPSGAGKSSLMQAGVIPRIEETHDFRVVRVDGWPPGEAPLQWLVCAIWSDLELGVPPGDKSALEALDEAMILAERRSEQPILIYLDQIEQLLFPERAESEAEALIEGVDRLARAPIQGLQIVLSLREDYLGRFRDRARDRRELLAHGFRLGPLTVGEMVKAVCWAAAEGQPPQRWDEAQLRGLMQEVRTPGQRASDEAEVQAAYAQIVCRALFQERAQGRVESEIEAESILHRYFETTLDDLGPLGPEARRLLEDHLVTADGSRTLRTEKELTRVLSEAKLGPILKVLEGAAILHAEAHQGSRYFEIGHDWLARKVHEARQQRERDEEERRARAEAERRLATERARLRFVALVALVSLVVAAGAGALGLYAWSLQATAVAESEKARAAEGNEKKAGDDAKKKAVEASDARLLAGFRELKNSDQLAWGTKLLPEVQEPLAARNWVPLASDALSRNTLFVTLRGHDKALSAAVWSHDGKRVLTVSGDKTARVWNADGTGEPVVLKGHEGAIRSGAFSPDDMRVVTASEDKTARVWNADGKGEPVVLKGHEGAVVSAAFSPDGTRVVTGSIDTTARVWSADGGMLIDLKGHKGPLTIAVFHPDGRRVLTASEDTTARVWNADGSGRQVVFTDHKAAVDFLAVSPDGTRVITASGDMTARIWEVSGKGKTIVFRHDRNVLHAAWSPDGTRVATASADKTARVWSADEKGDSVVLSEHTQAVTFVAFRPDGRYVATASRDRSARIWPVEGGASLDLRGHEAQVLSATWSPDGREVLTASGGEGERSLDHTARIWRPASLESLPRERPWFFHSAFIGKGGDVVVSAYDDDKARLWRVDGKGDAVEFKGPKAWVANAALSPDGKRVITVSFDHAARVWSADGKGEPVLLDRHRAPVRAAAFSPDGRRVVTASDDKTALVWNADGKGEPVLLGGPSGHTDGLTSAAWSSDGKRVVTTSMDHTARVWHPGSGGDPVLLKGHGDAVVTAAWSPDGARIVTASEDGTAEVWSADSGASVLRLDHGSPVLCAIWSQDGKRIATSSLKEGIWLWSADGKGEPIKIETPAPVIAMAFVEGGQRILTVAADNTTRTWTIDVGTLKQGLVETNADCLPEDMRVTYLGESMAKAGEQVAACECKHRRTPALAVCKELAVDGDAGAPAPASAASGEDQPRAPRPRGTPGPTLGASDLRVTVVVLPGDALVEVDGQPVRRRNGVVELVGKVDEVRGVRVRKGEKRTDEKMVKIKETGASPSLVDLNERPPPGAAGEGKAKPKAIDIDD